MDETGAYRSTQRQHGDVVNREVPLGHDLHQIAVREGISQVPANAQDDDHVFEMPPAEQCCPSSGHDTPYQIRSNRICNRTFSTPLEVDNAPLHGNNHSLRPVIDVEAAQDNIDVPLDSSACDI